MLRRTASSLSRRMHTKTTHSLRSPVSLAQAKPLQEVSFQPSYAEYWQLEKEYPPKMLDVQDEFPEWNEFATKMTPLIRDYYRDNADASVPILNRLSPRELHDHLQLDLPDRRSSVTELAERVEDAIRNSTRTGKPLFLDKLSQGSDAVGQWSEFLLALINTNVHTYSAAPVITLMELTIIREFASRFLGWDGNEAEGVFTPGGSYTNFLAMRIARDAAFPHVLESGWKPEDRPVAFCSDQSHYSVSTTAQTIGIGKENLVKIPADIRGQMDVRRLEREIRAAVADGKRPFYLSATTGTTVMGGYDLLEDLADLAEEYGMWLHADGCWGGHVVVSDKYRHLMKGIERCDSFALDPQKAMGVAVQNSFLLTRKKGYLWSCASNAQYLFHNNDNEHETCDNFPWTPADLDMANKTLQCGRKGDAFKLWMAWNYHGTEGFVERMDKQFGNAKYLADRLLAHDNFLLIMHPTSLNVCFYVIPSRYVNDVKRWKIENGHYSDNDELLKILGRVTERLRPRLIEEELVIVDYSPLPPYLPNFFRLVTANHRLETRHIDFMLDHMVEVVDEMYPM